MSNFRPGTLVQGAPLGATTLSVNLIADNTNILIDGISLIKLTSELLGPVDSGIFTIQGSSLLGHQLVIIYEAATGLALLQDSGNMKLEGPWSPSQYDSITIMWDGFNWIQVSAASGSTVAAFNPLIVAPSAGDALLYNDTNNRWQNRAMSGDATQTKTGALTIANLAITDAKVSASAAIAFSKLAALPSGQIIVGSAGTVPTAVAMSGDATLAASGALTIANLAITNAKVAAGAGIALNKLATSTASMAVVTDVTGYLTTSTVTAAEIGYLAGSTSNIQSQIDNKVGTSLVSGNILVGSAGNAAASVTMSGDATIIADGTLTIAANAVTIAKSARNIIMESTGTISSAQILALSATPVELVAAAPAGYYYVVDEMEIFHDYATAGYIAGGTLIVELGTTDLFSFPTSLVTGVADQYFLATVEQYATSPSGGVLGMDITTSIASNIQITNSGVPFLNGDAANILKYRIRYHMVEALT